MLLGIALLSVIGIGVTLLVVQSEELLVSIISFFVVFLYFDGLAAISLMVSRNKETGPHSTMDPEVLRFIEMRTRDAAMREVLSGKHE